MSERETKFEEMLQAVQREYGETLDRMDRLKAEGRTKSATYRQLMSRKLTLHNMLSMYRLYGLLD